MSAVPEQPDGFESERFLAPGECPLCGTPVADVTERCPECGMDLAGVPPRPVAYSRTAIVLTIVGFAIVYLVILLAVVVDS
ncbi:MAG: hypothetical protein FJW95_12965 [Actinobacteria bacterium]|nr:hypothetical protein [Actinomycetota bacterium]